MMDSSRFNKIMALAIPCTIAQASALLMVIVDMMMVGSLGSAEMAAIAIAGFGATLIFALVSGFAPAVQGMVARKMGESGQQLYAIPLNNSLVSILMFGLPLSVLCYWLTPLFFRAVASDPQLILLGVPYLQTLFFAVVAIGMNNAFKGYWAGMSMAKTYMFINLFTNAVNILLNYILIYGHFGAPAMGLWGAAIATVISLYLGTLIFLVTTLLRHRQYGFLRQRIEPPLVKKIFMIGLPATLQEVFFSLGYLVFFWMIGQVGTTELAAANVLVRIVMILSVFSIALGMSAATLVGQELGKGDIKAAIQWGWDVSKIGVVWVSALGLPLLFFPEFFLLLFLVDAETIQKAIVPLQMVAVTTGIGSMIYIYSYSLFSMGKGKGVFLVSFITQWFLFLPLVWIVGPYLHYGLLEIWIAQMVYGVSATAMITYLWMSNNSKMLASVN